MARKPKPLTVEEQITQRVKEFEASERTPDDYMRLAMIFARAFRSGIAIPFEAVHDAISDAKGVPHKDWVAETARINQETRSLAEASIRKNAISIHNDVPMTGRLGYAVGEGIVFSFAFADPLKVGVYYEMTPGTYAEIAVFNAENFRDGLNKQVVAQLAARKRRIEKSIARRYAA